MKLGFSTFLLYDIYNRKREHLPLYYCHEPFQYPYVEGGVHMLKTVDKGLYRCEDTNDGFVTIYDTYVGTSMSKGSFEHCFKKPSKLRLFLHKHFI